MRDVNHTSSVIAGIQLFASQLVLKVANRIIERVREAWDQGKDALGRAWAELSPETIAKKGFDRKLFEKGDMRASTYANRTGPLSAAAGVADEKARLHEFGVPENNVPARPMLGPAVQWAERDGLVEDAADDLFGNVVLRGL